MGGSMSSIVVSGDTSGAITISAPAISGTNTLTLPANTGTIITTASSAVVTPTMLSQPLTSGTAVASTSGTSIDFTSIPSWVKRVTVMFNEVSLSATANILIRLGTSSGVVSTGYISTSNILNNASGSSGSSSTTGFLVFDGSAGYIFSGTCVITLVSSNTFVATHSFKVSTSQVILGAGSIALGGTLDRVRITSDSTDTFDAGSINILYE